MKELQGKFIYYKMGDEATDDYSEEHLFAVPPLAGTLSERGTKAILFDDLGNVLYVLSPAAAAEVVTLWRTGRGSVDMTYTWNEYGRPSIYTTMAVTAEILAGDVDGAPPPSS